MARGDTMPPIGTRGAPAAYYIRPATPGDLETLAASMRAEDAAEVKASCGLDPLQALQASAAASEAPLALELGGELAALFGVAPGPRTALLGPTSYDVIWALTGRAVDRHRRGFWLASQRVVEVFLEHHPVLVNYVDARYDAALRWVARLGAQVLPAIPFGASGLPFHPVIWRAPPCAIQ